jgi:hypothetical protein
VGKPLVFYRISRFISPSHACAPHAAFGLGEETGVAQDLELLADFVADMTVVGMQFLQFAFVGVNVRIRKGRAGLSEHAALIRNPPHNIQHVQRPAALGHGQVFELLDATSSGGVMRV